jgi:hypothetical protein
VFGRQILSLTVNEPALTVVRGLAASRLGLGVGFRLLMQELDAGHLLAAFGDLDLAPTSTSGGIRSKASELRRCSTLYWTESGFAPGHYSREQFEELDRLAHQWLAEHPQAHLADDAGILQADAYSGYNKLYELDRKPGPIVDTGCWSHARRRSSSWRIWPRMPVARRRVKRVPRSRR